VSLYLKLTTSGIPLGGQAVKHRQSLLVGPLLDFELSPIEDFLQKEVKNRQGYICGLSRITTQILTLQISSREAFLG
jgi:hypothetical protein